MIHSIVQLVALVALGAGLWSAFGWGIAAIVLGVIVFVFSVAIEAYANRSPAPDSEPKDGD